MMLLRLKPVVGRLPCGAVLSRHQQALSYPRAFASSPRPPWEVLGVKRRSTPEEVKEAYRKEAKRLHPDLQPDCQREAAASQFQELESAYRAMLEELKNPGSTHTASQSASNPWGQAPQKNPAWEKVRQAAAYRDKWYTDSPMDHLEKLGKFAAGAVVLMFAWSWYRADQDRRDDQRDWAEFGVRRMKMKQQEAEEKQEKLMAKLRKGQRTDNDDAFSAAALKK